MNSGDSQKPPRGSEDPTLANESLRAGPGDSRDQATSPRAASPTGSSTVPDDFSQIDLPGYQILAELGRGGMGVVYRAQDTELNRTVALKMILSGAHAGEEEIARFHSEAEAVAQLQHPNIVQVFDVGRHHGKPYCALEYVEGGSLDQLLAHQKLSIAEAVDMVEALAHAMQSAHQSGIVHRDLKPANVLLVHKPDGSSDSGNGLSRFVPKITDFGLAKRVEQDSNQTRTGAVLGTPSYMAPEQARGAKRVGPAADIYALGAILYEMLCGKPPFRAASPLETILQVCDQEPTSPRTHNSQIDRDLDTICLKCLEKDPAKRYASAEQLAQDLQRYREGLPIEARPVTTSERLLKWSRRHPQLAALAVVTLLAVVGMIIGGIWFNTKLSAAYNEKLLEQQKTADALQLEQAARVEADDATKRAQQSELISRQRLIDHYVNMGMQNMNQSRMLEALPWFAESIRLEDKSERQLVQRIRFHHALSNSPRPVRTWLHNGALGVFDFSPDGRYMAVAATLSLVKIWDLDENRLVHSVRHLGRMQQILFSKDSSKLMLVSERLVLPMAGKTGLPPIDVKLWDMQQGDWIGPGLVVNSQSPLRQNLNSASTQSLTLATVDDASPSQFKLLDLATGQTVGTIDYSSRIRKIRFHPNGDLLFIQGDTASVWDAQTGRPVTENIETEGRSTVAEVSFDHAASRLCMQTGSTTALVKLPSGNTIFTLETESTPRTQLSPDGQSVAFLYRSGKVELVDVDTAKTVFQKMLPVRPSQIQFSLDSQNISVTSASAVFLLDAETGASICSPLSPVVSPSAHARFHPIRRQMAVTGGVGTLSGTGFVRVWDYQRQSPDVINIEQTSKVSDVAAAPNGRWLLAAAPHELTLHEIQSDPLTVISSTKLTSQADPRDPPQSMAWSDDSRLAAVGYYQGRIELWEIDNRKLRWQVDYGEPLTFVRFDTSAKRLVSFGKDGLARIRDTDTGQPISPQLKHPRTLVFAAFSNADQSLVTVAQDFKTRIWDWQSGKQTHSLPARMTPVSATWNRERNLLAVCGVWLGQDPGRVAFFDLNQETEILEPISETDPAMLVRFDPGGRRILVCTSNGTARIRSVQTGELLATPMNHSDEIVSAQFSHNGRLVLIACRDRTLRVWDAESGRPVTPPIKHDDQLHHALFIGQQYRIASCAGKIVLRDLRSSPLDDSEIQLVSRFVSGHELSPRGAVVPVSGQWLRDNYESASQMFDEDSDPSRQQPVAATPR